MKCWLLALATVGWLTACGGGASSPLGGSNATAEASAPVQLSGSVVKGPVSGSKVCVYEMLSSGKGKLLACTTSIADGTYSLIVPYEGDVVVEATGGTYTDEATGATGVSLDAPLVSAARVGRGSNTLHATPLTALAFGQSLGEDGFNIAAFRAKAAQIRDAFGLPADADLNTTLPDVRPGFTNPYGEALRAISKMLGMGATLSGVVGNSDLMALKKAYQQARLCLPSVPIPAKAAMAAALTPGEVKIVGGGVNIDGAIFTVTSPDPAWRALLAESETPMGCSVTTNTPDLVVLSCPQPALQGNLTLTAGTSQSQSPMPTALPTGGVLALGGDIQVLGGLTVGGNLTISADTFLNGGAILIGQGGTLTLGGLAGSSGTGTPAVDLGQINFQRNGSIIVGTPPLSNICLSGTCQVCPLSLNGGQCGGGIPSWPSEGVFSVTAGVFSVTAGPSCGSSVLTPKGVLVN